MERMLEESGAELRHIKNMMERSSRFISLSGWSGVSAGICALIGAFFAKNAMTSLTVKHTTTPNYSSDITALMNNELFQIAVITFIGAFVTSFLFTWKRIKKTNTSLWGATSKRLFINVSVPMGVGGIFLLKLLEEGVIGYIAPGCSIFYGLALVNASKFTLGEVRYLGYLQLLLGTISLWFIGNGLLFWTIGFGILHIVYGLVMWYKYERN